MADTETKKGSRLILPNTVRLELSDGDWVEVKERLSYGESQRLSSSMLRYVKTDTGENEIGIDFAKHSLLRMETWLTDWSFRDHNDKPVPLSRSAIENLDAQTAGEIDEALTAHIEALGKAPPANGKA